MIGDFEICLKQKHPSVIVLSGNNQNGINCRSGTNFPFAIKHIRLNGRRSFIEDSVFGLELELKLTQKNILRGITAKSYNLNVNGNIQKKVEFIFVI